MHCTHIAVAVLTLAAAPQRAQSCPGYHQLQGTCIEPAGGDDRERGERRVVRIGERRRGRRGKEWLVEGLHNNGRVG